MFSYKKISLLFPVLFSIAIHANAQVKTHADSGIVINIQNTPVKTKSGIDSMLSVHPMLNSNRYTARDIMHIFNDNTFDFYLVLGLLLAFGLMRFTNPRYFQYLLRAFRSPSFGSHQLKDQIDTAVVPNFLMNLFFAASGGIYIYYIFRLYMPERYSIYSPTLVITILIIGLAGLYTAKYVVMRFSAWAFNVRVIISHYMYNVFLINKIISITLLPFIILLAFTQPEISTPAMIVSLVAVGLLFLNRYVRSWQVFGKFFQYSKFHFFTYLCASELLPMALLTKLLIHGMYY
jgi:hypothetical protein